MDSRAYKVKNMLDRQFWGTSLWLHLFAKTSLVYSSLELQHLKHDRALKYPSRDHMSQCCWFKTVNMSKRIQIWVNGKRHKHSELGECLCIVLVFLKHMGKEIYRINMFLLTFATYHVSTRDTYVRVYLLYFYHVYFSSKWCDDVW